MQPEELTIGGRKFIQYWKDSEGRAPNMPPGTRVKHGSVTGTIRHQTLHSDCGESFFGLVVFESDDGVFKQTHCWMCETIDETGEPK